MGIAVEVREKTSTVGFVRKNAFYFVAEARSAVLFVLFVREFHEFFSRLRVENVDICTAVVHISPAVCAVQELEDCHILVFFFRGIGVNAFEIGIVYPVEPARESREYGIAVPYEICRRHSEQFHEIHAQVRIVQRNHTTGRAGRPAVFVVQVCFETHPCG